MKIRTAMAALTTALTLCSAHAANDKYLNFLLDQVHASSGMTQCDAALRKVFFAVQGDDLRVETFSDVMDNTVKVLAVFGENNRPIQIEMLLRREPQACRFTSTVRMTYRESCAHYLKNYPMFKPVGQSLGVTFAKSPNQVHAVLTPVGDYCMTEMHMFGTERVTQ